MKNKAEENAKQSRLSLTRRGFLTTVSAGAVALAAPGALRSPAVARESPVVKGKTAVTLTINNRPHRLLVEPRWSLLYVLRERLGLIGTKVGCGRGECGACSVLIDDVARYSCLTLAVEAEGSSITTVEGLLRGEELGPVQKAFVEKDAYQCGYCTSGQIMAVEALLLRRPNPALEEIRRAVSGNLCRCGAYANIFKAAERAAELGSTKK